MMQRYGKKMKRVALVFNAKFIEKGWWGGGIFVILRLNKMGGESVIGTYITNI